MNRSLRFVLFVAIAVAIGYFRTHHARTGTPAVPPQLAAATSLTDARRLHPTHLTRKLPPSDPPDVPPAGVFALIRYPAPAGQLPAYVTVDPHDGRRHPAIVWITGGDCNSIGDCWSPQGRDNDQSAAAYRKAGIVMMFPTLRGGNDAVGAKEKFCGETDDVIAAAADLATRPWVDPTRIYLGGHSTGGHAGAYWSRSRPTGFRAVFCFGPVRQPPRVRRQPGAVAVRRE